MTLAFPRITSGVIAIDTETWDPFLMDRGPGWAFGHQDFGHVVGFSVAWGEPGQTQGQYYPIRHEGGGNYPADLCLRWLRDVCMNTNVTKIMFNRLYDQGWLRREGIPVLGTVYDAQTAIQLLDEYRMSYSLDACLRDYLGSAKKQEAIFAFAKHMGWARTVKQSKGTLWKMPASVVAPYATQDAVGTLDLWHRVKQSLVDEDLGKVFQLETDLIPVLLEMRWRGIPVDTEKAVRASEEYRRRERDLAQQMRYVAGCEVDVDVSSTMENAFTRLGIPLQYTDKGNVSFDVDVLRGIDHPLCQMILETRKLVKTRNTFLDSYLIAQSYNGRVFPQIHPLPRGVDGGAVTGRPSVSNPNVNNLPNVEKDPINGKLIRGCFLPEHGEFWASCDYAQQEPRLMVHYASLLNVPGAHIARDMIRADPTIDFHGMMATLTGMPRKTAKAIFLGKCYGMGPKKYCYSVGLPTKWIEKKVFNATTRDWDTLQIEVAGDEAQEQLDTFARMVPWVAGLDTYCKNRAKAKGVIRTLYGRRARFNREDRKHGKRDFTYKATNKLIQGSAADQTKAAMVALGQEGIYPYVFVYDELGSSCGARSDAERIVAVMRDVVPLEVPVTVDLEMGANWGACV